MSGVDSLLERLNSQRVHRFLGLLVVVAHHLFRFGRVVSPLARMLVERAAIANHHHFFFVHPPQLFHYALHTHVTWYFLMNCRG